MFCLSLLIVQQIIEDSNIKKNLQPSPKDLLAQEITH